MSLKDLTEIKHSQKRMLMKELSFSQKLFILNIMSNFIPNEIVTMDDRDPPWINIKIKSLVENKTGYCKIYFKPNNAASLRHFEQM